MSNQTQRTRRTMKPGTDETSQEELLGQATTATQTVFSKDKDLAELKHNILEFKGNVEVAAVGDIVETTPDVISHYNPRGLGKGSPWFLYNGRIVCEKGTAEEVDRLLNLSHEEVLHSGAVIKTT